MRIVFFYPSPAPHIFKESEKIQLFLGKSVNRNLQSLKQYLSYQRKEEKCYSVPELSNQRERSVRIPLLQVGCGFVSLKQWLKQFLTQAEKFCGVLVWTKGKKSNFYSSPSKASIPFAWEVADLICQPFSYFLTLIYVCVSIYLYFCFHFCLFWKFPFCFPSLCYSHMANFPLKRYFASIVGIVSKGFTYGE